MRWVVNATPRLLYPLERPGTRCIGGWLGPRAGLVGAENLAPAGIRSPDRPARSQSLYRLRYPGPRFRGVESINFQYKRTQTTSIFRVEKSRPI